VGHYREASGWGQVTRDQILALDSAGVSVVPRSIDLGLAHAEVPERILQLEQGNPKNCSTIIQHVLPHHMKYDDHFAKNVGMFELESLNIQHTSWIDHLNIMDEVWVPCSHMLNLKGMKKPCHLIPHACDIEEYNQEYEQLEIPVLRNKFVFYFIGTYNRRKHVSALLRAFHTEFEQCEPVELVLKMNHPSMNSDDLAKEVYGLTQKIKEHLRLYNDLNRYKNEVIITVNVSRDELLRLHTTCDCFVCPSFGEAWCAPAFDAMGMGNIVISGKVGGPNDYVQNGINGLLVNGKLEPVFGETESFPEFGTARELEFDISISDLQHKMRYAYENRNDLSVLRQNARNTAKKYSYTNVGSLMKERLNA
jgi:glycosyltransferase involved in cell wall biosynthesis